MTIILPQRC